MITKMSTKEAQETYSHRMGMVEHTFGHTKHNLDQRQVSRYGLEDMETEQLLHAINYNANRYLKLKKEKDTTNNKKSTDKSLQTTLKTEQHGIFNNNHNYANNLNPKFYNNNTLMKTKAPIA